MIKKRVIATIIIKDGWAVQSIGFNNYLPVGKAEIAAEFFNEWGVDEIALIDISATRNNTLIQSETVKKVASKIFTPLSVGGGIKTIDDIRLILDHGADKVIINHALKKSDFIQKAIHYFGKQCIIASVDAIQEGKKYYRYDYLTHNFTDDLFQTLQSIQTGEILLNSVNRDGMKNGYDLELYTKALEVTQTPLIAMGGAKNPYNLRELFDKTDLSAAAAANFFHYYEHSISITKALLKSDTNRPIRHDGLLKYNQFEFDEDGRIKKQDEEELQQMLFEHHQREII